MYETEQVLTGVTEAHAAADARFVIGSGYHKTEYRERRNHYAVYSVNTPVDGFDTSRDDFLGAYRGVMNPEAVENGKCTNSMASGWSPIASHQINMTIAPGETKPRPMPDS